VLAPPGNALECAVHHLFATVGSSAKRHRPDFRRGDKITFDDKYLQPQVGTIVCINQRTATVDTGDPPGWRVPFTLLRRVVDI
jgi:hypothetical protein